MTEFRLHHAQQGESLALGLARGNGPVELLVLVCDGRGDLFRRVLTDGIRPGQYREMRDLVTPDRAGGVALTIGPVPGPLAAGMADWPLWLHAVEDAESFLDGPPGPGARPLLTQDTQVAANDLAGILDNLTHTVTGRDLVEMLGEDVGGILHRRVKAFRGFPELGSHLSAPAPRGFGMATSGLLVLQARSRHAAVAEIQSLCASVAQSLEPLNGIEVMMPSKSRSSLLGTNGQFDASLYLACGTALPGWQIDHSTATRGTNADQLSRKRA
ncbi:MAG: hypothetical protein PVH31_07005 [Ectothiorhodospiraceae bacterium]|jgi:hypothetical protein